MSMFAALSPRMSGTDGHSLMSESVESLLSLYSMITADGLSLNSGTPDLYRKSQTEIARHATNFVRNSGGKSGVMRRKSLSAFLSAIAGELQLTTFQYFHLFPDFSL